MPTATIPWRPGIRSITAVTNNMFHFTWEKLEDTSMQLMLSQSWLRFFIWVLCVFYVTVQLPVSDMKNSHTSLMPLVRGRDSNNSGFISDY
jgi:hypothetical protein